MSKFKIAVMGFGPTSEEAPIGDPSWKIFGLPWDDKYKYFHNLYEMHSKPVMELSNALVLSERWTGTEVETICHRPRNYPKILLEISENKNQTLYCQEAYFPGCLAYPFDKVIPFTGDYFISSVAYMLAHAISMRPDVLAVYGIDLQDDHEWDYQRACVEYMLGLARGMGTKIIIPEGSALLKLDKIKARFGGINIEYTGRYGMLSSEPQLFERWDTSTMLTKRMTDTNATSITIAQPQEKT